MNFPITEAFLSLIERYKKVEDLFLDLSHDHIEFVFAKTYQNINECNYIISLDKLYNIYYDTYKIC